MAKRFRNLLARRRFELLPLQTPWVQARLALPEGQLLTEMKLLRRMGSVSEGRMPCLKSGGISGGPGRSGKSAAFQR